VRFGDVFNPSTGQIQARVGLGARADLDHAPATAQAARPRKRRPTAIAPRCAPHATRSRHLVRPQRRRRLDITGETWVHR
jgi:acyl-CoA reductase-like NAD-dependent aldehyde dehydrogenase